MFDSSDYPKSLEERIFQSWFEAGRASKLPYAYLLIIWDELEARYLPMYTENREGILDYERFGQTVNQQSLVAAYDLYSESRML
jgi:hypothetical protein